MTAAHTCALPTFPRFPLVNGGLFYIKELFIFSEFLVSFESGFRGEVRVLGTLTFPPNVGQANIMGCVPFDLCGRREVISLNGGTVK